MTDFNTEILVTIRANDWVDADDLAEQIVGEIKARHGLDGHAVIAGIPETVKVINASVESVAEKRERRIR